MKTLAFAFAFAFTLTADSRFVRLIYQPAPGPENLPRKVEVKAGELCTLRGFSGHGPAGNPNTFAPAVTALPAEFNAAGSLEVGESILGPATISMTVAAFGSELLATLEIQAASEAAPALRVTVHGSADLQNWQPVATLRPGTNHFFKVEIQAAPLKP